MQPVRGYIVAELDDGADGFVAGDWGVFAEAAQVAEV
jgi:hypothetical protein